MENKTKKESAIYYQKLGLSIIPTKADKTPYLNSWKEYQEKKPSNEQILGWWNKWPDANPAVVTGKVSGLVVLDLDSKHNRSSKEFNIPATACAKSGNNGEHFFFKHPGVFVENKSAISGPGVDIRADGGYILLAPSTNVSGGLYEWIIPLEDGLSDIPEWLKEITTNKEKKWLTGKDGVSEGSRNDTAASMAGKILSSTAFELWESIGWEQLLVWNQKNPKPLHEKELRGVWDSIKIRHMKDVVESKIEKGSQADKLIEIIENNKEIVLFHDEFKQPYITIPINNHNEIWRCSSSQLKNWLSKIFWDKYKKAPNSDALNTALTVIKGKAGFEGDEIDLYNRVALKDNILWYDLCGLDWKAIKITEEGWNIIDNPPIIFRRYGHQKSQIVPQGGGDVKEILKYVNITDGDHQILFLVWVISCFIPGFPHPLPYIYGPQGSAKSTVSKISREIIDPSLLSIISFPKKETELVQVLSHNWMVFFDNVSQISEEISDMLCKGVSGGGFSKRELYTDDEDIIYNFKRCMGINGINLMAIKPDLLERSILFELERVGENNRKQEKDLMEDFEKQKPIILGSIFDSLSKAMKIKKDIKLAILPRMADFAGWGCAIAESIGYSQQDFLDAYNRNINSQNREILYEDPVALLVLKFMEDQEIWEGTATKLLTDLTFLASDEVKKSLPKSANHLSNSLNRIKSNLEVASIKISKVDGKERKIIIEKVKDEIHTIENLTTRPLLNLLEDDGEHDNNDIF